MHRQFDVRFAHAGDIVAEPCQTSLTAAGCCAQFAPLELCAKLRDEFKPVGALENILVAEMARRAANMQWWSAAADAVRQTAAKSLGNLVLSTSGSPEHADTTLAAAAACDAVDLAERTSSKQSRAFYQALQTLLQLQQRRTAVGKTAVASQASNPFPSEADCLNYLVDWQLAKYICRACGTRRAKLIASRSCLACAGCGTQSGLRVATVMADSSLSLLTWFAAIGIVVDNPDIGTIELQRQLGLSRPATVRRMVAKIHAALTVDERTELLAGLDRYFSETESSVRPSKNLEMPKVTARPPVDCTQIISHQELAPTHQGMNE